MTRYIEPTLRSRQLFFLYVILLGGFALFVSHLDDILLPLLSCDPLLALEQTIVWSLVSTILTTILYLSLSVTVIYYTRRAVQSGQWPAKGMTVPFRTKVTEIKNPRSAWLYLIIVLTIFTSSIVRQWLAHDKSRIELVQIRQWMQVTPNPAFKRDCRKSAAAP
jgi:hypothetical protein